MLIADYAAFFRLVTAERAVAGQDNTDYNRFFGRRLTQIAQRDLASQTFTVPSDKMIAYRNGEMCKNVDVDNGIISTKFDFAKCTFIINIKNASITDYGLVDFGIGFFGINILSGEKIDLGERRTYGLEELRRYDVLGAWWEYYGEYCISFKPPISPRTCDSDSFTVEVVDVYTDPYGRKCTTVVTRVAEMEASTTSCTDAERTHITAWVVDSDIGEINITLDAPLIAPELLRLGQQYSDSDTISGQGWITV